MTGNGWVYITLWVLEKYFAAFGKNRHKRNKKEPAVGQR